MSFHSFVLPLVLVLFLSVYTKASDEAVKKEADLDKRTPFFFPLRPYSTQQQADEVDDEEDNEFDRKRRTPFFFANPKLWKAARNIETDEDDSELDNVDDGFERRRRIPYYYPRYDQYSRQVLNDDELEELEEKRSLRKRGIPYYFPRLNYAFLPRMDDGNRKRFGVWKRGAKRSLAEALEHDDVTDFGYDKRQSLVEVNDENEDDKRKKKRTLLIKKSG